MRGIPWIDRDRLTLGGAVSHGGGSGGGGGGQTNTVQKADPWAGQQPYLSDVMQQANNLYYTTPTQYYDGQTYAPLSDQTETALQMQEQRALAGSPLVRSAQDQLTATMRGDYMTPDSNPYLQGQMDRVTANVLPQVNARFAASGRSDSGLAARAAAEGLADAQGGLLMQNYNAERGRQIQGMMFAPSLAKEDYTDAARLAEVGAAREDYTQQGINDAIARFNFQQQEPWQRLGQYSNMVQGHYGGTTETSTPQARRSIGAGLLGGAATGGGLGYMMSGGDPYYAALAAAGGGLLSQF